MKSVALFGGVLVVSLAVSWMHYTEGVEKPKEGVVLMDGKKDDIGLDLESMGIDYIAVDEMHEFKNLEY